MSWFELTAGVCLTHGICQLALGLKRPIMPVHLWFALMMGVIGPFQLVAGAFESATSIESAVALARYGVLLGIVFMTTFGVFVRRYTQTVVPPLVGYAFLAINAAFFVYTIVAPHGLLFSSDVVTRGPANAPTKVPLHAVQLAWHAFNTLTVLWAIVASGRMVRRARRRGILLCVGASALFITVLADALRDVIGTEWPYVAGFGVMAMATALSIELAMNFRDNENLLARLLVDAMRVRDLLNTPLQVLQVDLELAGRQRRINERVLARLQRNIDKLTRLGRMLHEQT